MPMELQRIQKRNLKPAGRDFANEFARDIRDGVYQFSALPGSAFERARQLSRQLTARFGTRTADLLHVASRGTGIGRKQPVHLRPGSRERWPRP